MSYTLRHANTLLCYDGTLEGFFSAVFHAYAGHIVPADIARRGNAQPGLGQAVVDVPTHLEHARRVHDGLHRKLGIRCYEKIRAGFLSERPGCERMLFEYIALGMDAGQRVLTDYGNPVVSAVERLDRKVWCEREKLYQFARFERLENGVYLARVNPNANVVPLSLEHFAERFSTQPFIIYDEQRKLAGVYDAGRTYLVSAPQLDGIGRADDENSYQQLWKTFYDAVSNEQRYNPSLRRSFMPQRLWRNITEMKLAVPSALRSA